MNTMNRRIEIINILIIRRHTTANELAQELGVSIRTTVRYSGFISTVSDLHEAGRKRRAFYKGRLQSAYQFTYSDGAGKFA